MKTTRISQKLFRRKWSEIKVFMPIRTQTGSFSEFLKPGKLIAKRSFPDNAAESIQIFIPAKLLTGIREDLKNEKGKSFVVGRNKINLDTRLQYYKFSRKQMPQLFNHDLKTSRSSPPTNTKK